MVLALVGLLTALVSEGQSSPAAAARPAFQLASILQSNMIVQQAKPLALWGTAPAGDSGIL